MKFLNLVTIITSLLAATLSLHAQEEEITIDVGEYQPRVMVVREEVMRKWQQQNLDVTQFKNGDPIPQAQSSEAWINCNANKKPCWCYFADDNGKLTSGKLYNFYAVTDPRSLAPEGWHIPTLDEWKGLAEAGQKPVYGCRDIFVNYSVADTCFFYSQNELSGIVDGSRYMAGEWTDLMSGHDTRLWTATASSPARAAMMITTSSFMSYHYVSKGSGGYVRCVKND